MRERSDFLTNLIRERMYGYLIIMPYEYDQLGLENKIEDHICQLIERFGYDKDKILTLVREALENQEHWKA